MTPLLVVHCVDAEGPLGGDARRNEDGSAEFYDNWPDILTSLAELTAPKARLELADSLGGGWRFTWCAMDFTGFKTNPKQRDTSLGSVYWHLSLNLCTAQDEFGFHHHCPPLSGEGDEWPRLGHWNSSEADKQLWAIRHSDRPKPQVFRAGGTIEDRVCSSWADLNFPLDFSNRVSERSFPGAPVEAFNWWGAPQRWGSYHPSHSDGPTRPGRMRRFVYRCIDLRSKYNELSERHVDQAFSQTVEEGRPAVLAFFSHDNRDMRDETRHAYRLIEDGSRRWRRPWRSCTASEAHRLHHGL